MSDVLIQQTKENDDTQHRKTTDVRGYESMQQNPKIKIYQGMIQYLLESTQYTLKNIADLSNSSMKNIRSIHCDGLMPSGFSSELQLVKLYQMVIEVNVNKNNWLKCRPQREIGQKACMNIV